LKVFKITKKSTKQKSKFLIRKFFESGCVQLIKSPLLKGVLWLVCNHHAMQVTLCDVQYS
jgi:hypothetical protein